MVPANIQAVYEGEKNSTVWNVFHAVDVYRAGQGEPGQIQNHIQNIRDLVRNSDGANPMRAASL